MIPRSRDALTRGFLTISSLRMGSPDRNRNESAASADKPFRTWASAHRLGFNGPRHRVGRGRRGSGRGGRGRSGRGGPCGRRPAGGPLLQATLLKVRGGSGVAQWREVGGYGKRQIGGVHERRCCGNRHRHGWDGLRRLDHERRFDGDHKDDRR